MCSACDPGQRFPLDTPNPGFHQATPLFLSTCAGIPAGIFLGTRSFWGKGILEGGALRLQSIQQSIPWLGAAGQGSLYDLQWTDCLLR